MREAVQARLERLSGDTRSLLAVASAFGGAFPLSIAASVAELTEAAALEAIDEALAAHMLQARPGRRLHTTSRMPWSGTLSTTR